MAPLGVNLRKLAFVAFFLSGASSLIFQSIWARMLGHVFGATGVAISTVVTVFMAGLGLGAWLAGRYGDRIKHPLMTYAVVELLVGFFALLVPELVSPEGWLADVNGFLRNELGAGSFEFMLARFFCVVPILIVPTTLMGSSLPLLSRHFVEREKSSGDVGSRVGALYAVNTLGAVCGVVLGGFILMPTIGLQATSLTAVAMNVLLAVGIFALRRPLLGESWSPGEKMVIFPWQSTEDRSAPEEDAQEAQTTSSDEPADDIALPVPAIARKAALATFAVSGAAALCSEVTWSRTLAMTIGSSVQGFSLILATYLTGISIGSALAAAAIGPSKRPWNTIGGVSIFLIMAANAIWAQERDWDELFAIGDFVLRVPSMWLLLSLVFAMPVLVVWVSTRARQAEGGGVEKTFLPAIIMLAVPFSAAILNGILLEGKLAMIASAVTAVLCVFAAIVVLLRRYPVLQLACVQLFIAGATFVNFLYMDDISCVYASLYSDVTNLHEHIGLVRFQMFLTAGFCTLPATLGMGAMFPMTLRLWTGGGGSVAEDVGNVYAANTLGSVVGAWVPGFVLMPWIGMEKTLLIGIIANLLLGLAMLVVSAAGTSESEDDADPAKPRREMPLWYAVVIYILAPLVPMLVAVLWFAAWQPNAALRWNRSRMTLGVFRMSLGADVCDQDSWGNADIIYYRDGLTTTVTVEKWGSHYALKNNGKVDASNGDDMPTQIMVAGYPLMMHREGPEGLDVAVIGFGSGVSVGTALQFPVASVDVVELERAIPEASKVFAESNHLDYNLPEFPYVEMDRLRVINDDGRNYLASTDRMYDVIVSEPSNPWITGVSDLFTTDHFRITKRRLREGGIYCQWVQLYELSPQNIKTIYRTFASQFEHVIVFAAEDMSSDTVLLGSDSPLPLDTARIREALASSRVREEMGRAHVHSANDVVARTLFADREEVLQFTQIEERRFGGEWQPNLGSINDPNLGCTGECRRVPVELNTDDNMLIEFAAPRDLIGFTQFEGYLANFYALDWPYGRLKERVEGLGEGEEGAANRAGLAISLMAHGRRVEAASYIEAAGRTGRSLETLVALETLTRLMTPDHEPAIQVEAPVPGPQLAAREGRQLVEGFSTVRSQVDQGAFETALTAMEEIPAPVRRSGGPSFRLLYTYLLYKTGDDYPNRYSRAAEELEDLIQEHEDYAALHPEVYYFLGRSYDQDMDFDRGTRFMALFVRARLASAGITQENLPALPADPFSPLPGPAPELAPPEEVSSEE